MLKPPYPSSPVRPPIAAIYFTGYTDEEQEFFAVHTYGAMYSAHKWMMYILETPAMQSYWQDDETLILTKNNHRLQIKSPILQDIIEYQPTKEEAQWHPNTNRS